MYVLILIQLCYSCAGVWVQLISKPNPGLYHVLWTNDWISFSTPMFFFFHVPATIFVSLYRIFWKMPHFGYPLPTLGLSPWQSCHVQHFSKFKRIVFLTPKLSLRLTGKVVIYVFFFNFVILASFNWSNKFRRLFKATLGVYPTTSVIIWN